MVYQQYDLAEHTMSTGYQVPLQGAKDFEKKEDQL